MRQKGVDWGLLTNGRQFEVYKRREGSSRPDEVSLAEFDLEDLDENWPVLRLLSKDLVESGDADTIAQRIEARKRAVKTLREEKEEIASRVARIFIDEIGDALAQEIEAESKKFVDEMTDSLETNSEIDLYLASSAPESPNSLGSSVPSNEKLDEERYMIAFYEDSEQIQSFAEESQADVMAEAVDYLIQQHDLIKKLDSLPYVPGEKNAVLSSEPEHPSGEEMRLSRTLPSGYHLFVALSKESKQRYVERFSEMCGLRPEFQGAW